jgi:hypothetical protein
MGQGAIPAGPVRWSAVANHRQAERAVADESAKNINHFLK